MFHGDYFFSGGGTQNKIHMYFMYSEAHQRGPFQSTSLLGKVSCGLMKQNLNCLEGIFSKNATDFQHQHLITDQMYQITYLSLQVA